MSGWNSFFNNSSMEELGGTQVPTTFDELLAQSTTSNPYGSLEAFNAAMSAQGGDGGFIGRPDNYEYNLQNTVSLPGHGDNWQWSNDGSFLQRINEADSEVGVNHVFDTLRAGEGGAITQGQTDFNQVDSDFEAFVKKAMPWAVGAITALAGGAAIGGYMGAGGMAAGEAGAAAASGAEGAAPAFTYGNANPSWMNFSQGMGTELGTGLYGTDPGSMAGMFGTTANTGGGLGSGIGSGLAAEGGIHAGLGGGWSGLMAQAGGGMASTGLLSQAQDAYRMYNQAQRLYQAATGGPAGAVGGPSDGFSGAGGMVGSGGLSQALSGGAGVKTTVPGMAELTDMTSEIGQIPLMDLMRPQMPVSNNSLPRSEDNAMLNGLGLGKFPGL